MPFLAGLAPAIAGGVASAGAGAAIQGISRSLQGQGGAGYQAPALGVTQSGGAVGGAADPAAVQQVQSQLAQVIKQQNPGLSDQQVQQLSQQGASQFAAQNSNQPQLVMPTTGAQGQQAYQDVQGALGQQQALASALQGQGGIQNQSDVFGQQQALANQLGQMAQGAGPNPALAQLAQTTGANTANQAALMAGQRGAGSNAGLIARQAAQQGAATQQQAVGQAATMRAQQQLAAIGALQQQQGMLGNLATQQVGQQMGAQQALTGAQMGEQGQILNALQGQNATLAGQQAGQNQINASMAQQNAQYANQLTSGIAGGIGSAIQSGLTPKVGAPAAAATGGPGLGVIPQSPAGGNSFGVNTSFAAGGQVGFPSIMKENYKGKSNLGRHLAGFAKGGKAHKMVDALVSPGEKILPPSKAKDAKSGKSSPLDGAKTVPGKPKVGGAVNSYANDTVPKKLAEGSIVLPRSVTQSDNPAEAAKKFVAALKSKKSKK